jgi:serine/threonine protein kinase
MTSLGSTLTDQSHHASSATPPPSTSSSLALTIASNVTSSRKRRRANLTRIAIGKLSSSNESLSSNASGGGGSQPTGLSQTDYGSDIEADSIFVSGPGVGSGSLSDDASSDNGQQKRFCPATHNPVADGSTSPNAASQPDDDESLAVVESGGYTSSTSKSASASQVTCGGLKIGGSEYEIVGDGRECKAVHIQSKTIFHCLIMKSQEYKTFLTILQRLKLAESLYSDEDEYQHLKQLLIPDDTESIRGDNGCWYVLLPDHQGNLHFLLNNNQVPEFGQSACRIFSERRIQPIFKQIVALVDFCHRIGIYFRDFRLRKFVFTDKDRTLIRVNNVLDLWVAPQIDNDQICQRYKSQVCPVYVAPEILHAGVYSGQPADVWALGILMFSLLTGRFPFHDPNPTALFKRIKARRFSCPINESISHNARWLLHSLLRQNPSERPIAAEILQAHWLQLEPKSLPDGRDAPVLSTKAGSTMTISTRSVFNMSPPPPAIVTNNNNSVPSGQPPAFVRLNSAPVSQSVTPALQQQASSSVLTGSGGSSLPSQTLPLSSVTSNNAIHVRLALVSARPPQASSASGGHAETVVQRETPSYPFCAVSLDNDHVVDQVVPELKKNSSAPSCCATFNSSCTNDVTLTTTISDRFYTRDGLVNNNNTTNATEGAVTMQSTQRPLLQSATFTHQLARSLSSR